jgi:large subunit ribosomal protein L9
MKVVLIEDVPKLGLKGEIKDVSDGYGRNYLIPRNLAKPATKGEIKHTQTIQQVHQEHEEKKRSQSELKMERLMKEFFTIPVRAGEKGKLYGSITNADVAKALSEHLDEAIDRKWIQVPGSAIKEIGTYEVSIKLPGGVKGKLKVKLEPQEEL